MRGETFWRLLWFNFSRIQFNFSKNAILNCHDITAKMVMVVVVVKPEINSRFSLRGEGEACVHVHTHTCLVGYRWIKSQLLEFPELTGHPEHISNQHVISLCCNGLINCLITWMQGVCIFLWQLVGIQQYLFSEWMKIPRGIL